MRGVIESLNWALRSSSSDASGRKQPSAPGVGFRV